LAVRYFCLDFVEFVAHFAVRRLIDFEGKRISRTSRGNGQGQLQWPIQTRASKEIARPIKQPVAPVIETVVAEVIEQPAPVTHVEDTAVLKAS
jgi:hypothetical protein